MGRRRSGITPGQRLRAVLEKATPLLQSISEVEATQKPRPEKWSAKEIMGHLTDSAVVNHQRFVKGSHQEHLILDGYRQDAWVSAQQYQARKWKDILALWERLNKHIADFVGLIPIEVLDRSVSKHNLDQILMNPITKSQPASLRMLIDDYIDHMIHHLRQVISDFTP